MGDRAVLCGQDDEMMTAATISNRDTAIALLIATVAEVSPAGILLGAHTHGSRIFDANPQSGTVSGPPLAGKEISSSPHDLAAL